MHPRLGQVTFNLAFFFTFMSGITLPFVRDYPAAFVVDTMAFIFSLAFLLLVVWEVRREARMGHFVGEQPPRETTA